MRLKRVRLFGFKTFADRTELNIDGGFIAVVGANGCGKSNLVDAILWGLGEGNSRMLRAATGQDVIFNGSPARKPVGYAEVALTFDNEDGALPMDSPEVVISRRITRGGDTEYAVNKRACRLRDIYELLADSGLGRSGYSIVGQKEIDGALTANADDRRAWIDEAAGVQRYRARKLESQRRLSQSHEHLSRVGDIIYELESQREPLREEAERAQRYRQVYDSLREVEVGLLAREAYLAVGELSALEARIAESTTRIVEEAARAESLDASAREMSARLAQLETDLETLRSEQQAALTAWERAESARALAQQRLESLDQNRADLEESREEFEARRQTAESELCVAQENASLAAARYEELETTLSGADAEAQRLRDATARVEQRLATARQREHQRLRAQAEAAHNADRIRAAQRELDGVRAAMPDLESALKEAQDSATEGATALADAEESTRGGRLEQDRIRDAEDKGARAIRETLAHRASLEGRKRGIEATIAAHEGLAQGARAVVEAARHGILDGEFTPVNEAIETDLDYALAIETALGASGNDLIVDGPNEAKRAVEWLKANQAGRATFQPISLMRPSDVSSELRRVLNENGVLGRASELVQCSARFRPVIDSLLGRIVIVEALDDALRLARSTGWSRMVSLDGEVVHNSGAVTGGRTQRGGYGMVQRCAELADIEDQLGDLERQVNEFETQSRRRSEAIRVLQEQIDGRQGELAELKSELEDRTAFVRSIHQELEDTRRAEARLGREIEALGGTVTVIEPGESVAELEAERDRLVHELAGRSADSEQAEARLQEARERRDQARAAQNAAQRRSDQLEADRQARDVKAENLGPLRERYRLEADEAAQAIEDARRRRLTTEDALAEAVAARKELQGDLATASEESRSARDNAATLSQANHQAEIAKARADARRANALARLLDEYGIAEPDALTQGATAEIPEDALALANRLRREIRAMGEVNLGAIDAFERLSVRYDELTAQRDDILDGIGQIEASIAELDRLTGDKFMGTFHQVHRAFVEIFQRLFPGGEGHLSLSEASSVLDSGVIIEVTLPGKRRQPLTLLSGGERSLCAIAFLFALLRVKPSPLVVLDEVDAPLDGRNVERFAALVQSFSEDMQFIVVTHNATTIAAAPVWFGVTMQEPGVSTLIPARLKDSKSVIADEAAIPGF